MPPSQACPRDRLLLDEPSARRLLLAKAVEEGDPEGRLVGLAEREQASRQALEAGRPAADGPLDEQAWLLARADAVLQPLRHRQPALAALERPAAWWPWLAWGLPLLAALAGGLADRLDHPRQVNLLSPPLLAFIAWNLAVYILLIAAAVWAWHARAPLGAPRLRWTPRRAGVRHAVAEGFARDWWQAAGSVESHRWRAVLHAAAAAWAVGAALSIVLGGVVREYRIGWESTLLDLPQVHAFLRLLIAPVVALLPVEPFSAAELARLHFGSGAGVGREEARRWVVLYVALLALVVVVPRLALAAWSSWRRRRLAARVPVDLRPPYFAALLAAVRPVRVVLDVPAAPQADPLATCWAQWAGESSPPDQRDRTLGRTDRGDVLQLRSGGGDGAPPVRRRWAWQRPVPAAPQRPDARVVVAAGAADLPAADAAGIPLLVVVPAGAPAAEVRAAARRLPQRSVVLDAADLPTWRQDERLWDALRDLLPAYQAPGLERLRAQWRDDARRRLQASMRCLAGELVQAARDGEALSADALGVRQLVLRGERAAQQEAHVRAQEALLARARERQAATDARLLALHGFAGWSLPVGEEALAPRFRTAQAVHEPQAGLAGAAGGAAMGAAVDLAVGGMTLGAASALGALIGGGAALAAAAWRNRRTEAGVALVAIGDDTLDALLMSALWRYLAACHQGRGTVDPAGWAAALEEGVPAAPQRAQWWAQARTQEPGAEDSLAAQLAPIATGLLDRLHPR